MADDRMSRIEKASLRAIKKQGSRRDIDKTVRQDKRAEREKNILPPTTPEEKRAARSPEARAERKEQEGLDRNLRSAQFGDVSQGEAISSLEEGPVRHQERTPETQGYLLTDSDEYGKGEDPPSPEVGTFQEEYDRALGEDGDLGTDRLRKSLGQYYEAGDPRSAPSRAAQGSFEGDSEGDPRLTREGDPYRYRQDEDTGDFMVVGVDLSQVNNTEAAKNVLYKMFPTGTETHGYLATRLKGSEERAAGKEFREDTRFGGAGSGTTGAPVDAAQRAQILADDEEFYTQRLKDLEKPKMGPPEAPEDDVSETSEIPETPEAPVAESFTDEFGQPLDSPTEPEGRKIWVQRAGEWVLEHPGLTTGAALTGLAGAAAGSKPPALEDQPDVRSSPFFPSDADVETEFGESALKDWDAEGRPRTDSKTYRGGSEALVGGGPPAPTTTATEAPEVAPPPVVEQVVEQGITEADPLPITPEGQRTQDALEEDVLRDPRLEWDTIRKELGGEVEQAGRKVFKPLDEGILTRAIRDSQLQGGGSEGRSRQLLTALQQNVTPEKFEALKQQYPQLGDLAEGLGRVGGPPTTFTAAGPESTVADTMRTEGLDAARTQAAEQAIAGAETPDATSKEGGWRGVSPDHPRMEGAVRDYARELARELYSDENARARSEAWLFGRDEAYHQDQDEWVQKFHSAPEADAFSRKAMDAGIDWGETVGPVYRQAMEAFDAKIDAAHKDVVREHMEKTYRDYYSDEYAEARGRAVLEPGMDATYEVTKSDPLYLPEAGSPNAIFEQNAIAVLGDDEYHALRESIAGPMRESDRAKRFEATRRAEVEIGGPNYSEFDVAQIQDPNTPVQLTSDPDPLETPGRRGRSRILRTGTATAAAAGSGLASLGLGGFAAGLGGVAGATFGVSAAIPAIPGVIGGASTITRNAHRRYGGTDAFRTEDGKRAAIAGTAYLMGYGMGLGGAGGGGEESGNRWAYDALAAHVRSTSPDEPIPTYDQWLARGGAEDAKTAAEAAPPGGGFIADTEPPPPVNRWNVGGEAYDVIPGKYNGKPVLTRDGKLFLYIDGEAWPVEETSEIASAIRGNAAPKGGAERAQWAAARQFPRLGKE